MSRFVRISMVILCTCVYPDDRSSAAAGLDALCRLDAGFASYRESLFSQAATSLSRDQQTQETIAKIDETLQAFLCTLSNHFLAPGSFKALEYLIRRYR